MPDAQTPPAEAVAKAEAAHPTEFRWKGVRFKRTDVTSNGTVLRYESDDLFYHGWVSLYNSGQWMAAFSGGPYSIEWDRDDALESARLKRVDHLYDSAARFESLGLRERLW